MKLLLALTLLCQIAFAAPPPLEPFRGKDLTISFPRGWKVAQKEGVYVVQQDPDRKDAAGILFVDIPNPNNTSEEALIEVMSGQVAKDIVVTTKAAIQGGVGHYAIADGTSDGVKVRLAAVAVAVAGKAIVCVFVSKVADFDGLGGLALATQVLASLTPDAPAAPAPAPAPAGNGKLTVPPLTRTLTVGDLAGEWTRDDSVMSSYVSTSTGNYAGYSAISTNSKWTIDARGNFASKLDATVAQSGSKAYQVSENATGTISISADGDLKIVKKTGTKVTHYQIRGWEVRPDIAVIKLNGPYYDDGIPARIKSEPTYGDNLSQYWVRVTAKK